MLISTSPNHLLKPVAEQKLSPHCSHCSTKNSVEKLRCIHAFHGNFVHRFLLGSGILSRRERFIADYGGCLHLVYDYSSCYSSYELRSSL
jgi:hypothetical protein